MLEKTLVALVTGILQYLMARKDLRDAAKAEVYRELYEKAKTVYDWELRAAAAPDGGGTLRVQQGSSGIQLSGDDAGTPGGADSPQVRRE